MILCLALWIASGFHAALDAPASAAQSNVGLSLTEPRIPEPPPSTADGRPADPAAPPSEHRFHRSGDGSAEGAARRPLEPITVSGAGVPWYRSGMVSLGLVLALAVGLLALLRRVVPGAAVRSGVVLNVAARAALSPKHSIFLVGVGRRRFVLVGLSPDGVTALTDLAEPDEVAELAAALLSAGRGGRSFETEFRDASTPFEDSAPASAETAQTAGRSLSDARAQLESALRKLRDKTAA